MQNYSKSQSALAFQALLRLRNCIKSHLLPHGSETALALEHLPSMAWKKQHWPAMDKSTCCAWIVTIQALSLSRAVTLSSFTKVLPRWQTHSDHLLLCTCWLKACAGTGVWPWLGQWLLSCTCFLKHTSWETAAWAEHANPLLSLLSKDPPESPQAVDTWEDTCSRALPGKWGIAGHSEIPVEKKPDKK